MVKKLLLLALVCSCLFIPRFSNAQKATIEQMIGQMIMVGINDTSAVLDSATIEILKAGQVGGIILFEKNLAKINTSEQVKALNKALQSASSIPLLIAIDQEGGKVNRLKSKYGFPESVSATYIGQTNKKDTSFYYAETTAKTLKELGFNLNFAPVVDLCTNPANPVIAMKERCYSANPDTVTRQARIFINAHHKMGVLTALKHFPGHGSSGTDTHQEMTDITNLWSEQELIPYRKLIREHKADAIMTAHIIHCRLDTTCRPATLSPVIINGFLRDSLGFQGVVFSDDMQMKAISSYYGFDTAICMAIQAGIDILVIANNVTGSTRHQASEVFQIIQNQIKTGQISEERIRLSYQRILAMKKKIYPDYKFPE
jgi:beta-N-acetylhexosaminidase